MPDLLLPTLPYVPHSGPQVLICSREVHGLRVLASYRLTFGFSIFRILQILNVAVEGTSRARMGLPGVLTLDSSSTSFLDTLLLTID